MRIRQGNDFIFLWAIERDGEPEDFSNAVNVRLHFKNYDCIGEVKSFQIVEGNIVRVEVSPEWASRLGTYRLILNYEFEDLSYSDGDRKCVVDVLAFNIVPKTSEADDVTEMAKTTDIMIGFYGLSAYEVWLKDNPESTKEDYYNWLRQPATDAVSLIDDKIEHLDEIIDSSTENEAERVTAESTRKTAEATRISAETERKSNEVERLANESSRASDELTRKANESSRKQDEATRKTNENERETAELTRQSSESERNENEGLRVNAENLRATAESSRASAESLRVEAELLRQTNTQEAITNAEEATLNANTSAQNADDAREAIQSDLGAKANHGYASIEVAKTLKQVEYNASGLIARYVHSQNLECFITSYDSTTGTFYTESNPFVNGAKVGVTLNSLFDDIPRASLYTPTGLATGNSTIWYIINATSTSFQLTTFGGVEVSVFANNPTQDLSKWKFEQPSGRSVTISNINRDRIRIVIEMARVSNNIATSVLINGSRYNCIDIASATSSYSNVFIPTRYSGYGLVDIEMLINSNSSVLKMEYNLFTENGNAVVNKAATYYSRIPITKVDTFMLDYFEPANGCTISIYKL